MKTTILLLLLLCGCHTPAPDHSVPNFKLVSPGIWRGGQPPDAIAWANLLALGITNVVKLNLWTEGSDAGATNNGMAIAYFPITQEQQLIVGKLRPHEVNEAVASIKPGTFVHCEHGQDRTGLIIACYRLQTGWTKPAAEQEMLTNGFHKILVGLWEYWERL